MNYDFEERVAIRIDSGMCEADAIALTKREQHYKPESVEKLESLRLKIASDHAAKRVSRRFEYS